MKKSEARILLFLYNADKNLCYGRMMSSKLNMMYTYLLDRLKDMHAKRWVKPYRLGNKVFYSLASRANIETATKVLEE